MKKIVESELKNRVNSLREYLVRLDERPSIGPDGKVTGGFTPQPAAVATPVAGSFDSFGSPVAPGSAAATSADPTGLAQAQQDVNSDSAVKVSAPTTPVEVPAAPVPVDPRDGPTGQALARMGISKQNRLDQAFVDKMLGAGKYKAGSAESNLALLKTKPQAPVTPPQPAPAPVTPPQAAPAPVQKDTGGEFWTTTNPPRRLTPDEIKRYGISSPVVRESVSYADDQTLARIVSLSRK